MDRAPMRMQLASLATLFLGIAFSPVTAASNILGYHRMRGTAAKLRRGRGGMMKPGLRVSRITGTYVARPRHASSTI